MEMKNEEKLENFDVSLCGNEFYKQQFKSNKLEKQKKVQNKLKKKLPSILSTLFFFLFIGVLILLMINSKKFTKLENKMMDSIFSPYHSDLIPNIETLLKLKNWISNNTFIATGNIYESSLRLYYKATKDGDNCEIFHQKTDKWDGYIVLIESSSGSIFGGYTSKNFKSNYCVGIPYPVNKVDECAFLFSLTNDEIYPLINKTSYSILGDGEENAIFGSGPEYDLWIPNFFFNKSSISNFPSTFNISESENLHSMKYRLTNGNKKFIIKEMEVFRVNLFTVDKKNNIY